MKKFISFFIKYSVPVNVIIFAFLILGLIGAMSLKSSFFPLVETKIITVQITYPGASPQEIEEGVVLQIEDNLKGILGIDRVTSVSKENSGTITVEALKGFDIDLVLADVKNAVDRVASYPTGMEPLVVAKKEETRETISFAISGKDIDLKTLKDISEEVENDLRSIEGISQVEISGFPLEEIEIAVSENSLRAYQLSFQEVAQAVAKENILSTGGNIKTSQEDYLIRANNRSYYADELDFIVIKSELNGNVVRLKDVATVRDIFQDSPNASFFNGDLAVNVKISNTNDEDLLSSADDIKAYIAKFNQENSNVQLNIQNDSSITLKDRTALLTENAVIGMILVLILLSLFLNTRLAFWVAMGMPVAFLGMFVFAGLFGVTINVLSLFGMIIVIGILVDDGIVIAENIYQHFEAGKGPIQAAIDGTMEVLPSIISAIITTVLAFSTFLFLDSRIGEFFGEVSVIVILTLVVSLIEAILILPAHIAHSAALVRSEDREEAKGFIDKVFAALRKINSFGDRLMNFMRDKLYTPVLAFALRNQFLSVVILISMMLLTRASIQGNVIGTTFFPSIASDRVSIDLKMPEGTSAEITDSIISYIEAKAWIANDEFTEKQSGQKQVVENVIKTLGPGTSNASLAVNLLPGEERDMPSIDIANRIEELTGVVYGIERLTYGDGGNFGGSPIAVSLLSNNIEELKAAKAELKEILAANPLLKNIADNDPAGIKEIRIELLPNAYLLGLNTNDVMAQVRAAFFGYQAQRFQRGPDEIKVWVRYDEENRSSIANLDMMEIVGPAGQKIPFAEIANYTIERGDVAINHLNGKREIQVSSDLKNREVSATDILADIQANIVPALLQKYPSVSALYEGQNREAGKFQKSAAKVLPVILLLIYVTIAFTFRSYTQPLLLLFLVPFSLIGVAWGHYFHGIKINILSFLGIIALVGIMVNDGLVLISKFNTNLKEGLKFEEALLEAGKSRFRAIFLTSITTIAGLGPLIFEKSRQAQFLIPMAVSIAYGIAIATILTLIILPILLSISNYLKMGFYWLTERDDVTKENVERAIMEIESENEDLH
ncbi:MAG: efflux RND transporter permease subunit [Chitinophagales bacterium]|nr:efflux RND transporter permease subunit [Chitinophagales bacterium]